jgi:hypothetical protein
MSNVCSKDVTLAFVLENGLPDTSQLVTLDQFSSDHLSVIFDVFCDIPSYKNVNWP